MLEREHRNNPHPPYCTCVKCVSRRGGVGPDGKPIGNAISRLWRSVRRAIRL
ncbi:MAG: hypothetical protein IH961_08395 [Chloroflexi bacterium]|nr:hypothetical protein [Chloroflexota bacterium]